MHAYKEIHANLPGKKWLDCVILPIFTLLSSKIRQICSKNQLFRTKILPESYFMVIFVNKNVRKTQKEQLF